MPSKQTTPTSTTTTTAPWSGVQPYLTDSLSQAQELYKSGAGYYPESTVAPLSGTSQQAIDLTTQRALNGSPLQSSAQGNATSTLNGEYLNSNPNLQGAIDAATQGLVRQYQTATLPGIQANFSKSGRYGSNAMGGAGGAIDTANNALASQIGNIASTMSYNNYNDERSRQVQTSALAPSLTGMDYTNLNALTGAGGALDSQAQAQLSDLVARYQYANGGSLDDYIARINGTGASNYKTENKANNVTTSPLAGALGGSLSGAATGSMIGGPWGALAGGVLGGIGGFL